MLVRILRWFGAIILINCDKVLKKSVNTGWLSLKFWVLNILKPETGEDWAIVAAADEIV